MHGYTIFKEGPRPMLITHAGITLPSLYGINCPDELSKGRRLHFIKDIPIEDHLAKIEEDFKKWAQCLEEGTAHLFMKKGTRMGEVGPGGPQWLDWSDFNYIKGLDQILGHTIQQRPQKLVIPNESKCLSANYCLDTNLKHFGVWSSTKGVMGILNYNQIVEKNINPYHEDYLWDKKPIKKENTEISLN
jgi:hypothetical protein